MSHEEFSEKVLSLNPRMLRLAITLTGDEAQARDAVQDVLEKLWRRRSTLHRCASIEAFAMQATRNRCYDALRRRKLSFLRHEPITPRTKAAETPGEGIRGETHLLIERAIAALPEKQRAAIHLRDVEDYGFEEIAAIMGCPVPQVRVYLSRARKAVSEKLKKHLMP